MPNALAHESSPYLRQHQHNPVAWQAWGPEAFATAKRLNKPILVSIGYSTCHWCHVMAHECFEDEATAARMNELLVCIKVDREEHPEVDAIYMDAVQALTGQGGWPLNAFADHAGRPFYACTYLPRPAWQRLLAHLSRLWTEDPSKVAEAAAQITEHLQDRPHLPGQLGPQIWSRLDQQLGDTYDHEHPGYVWNTQRAPKFPSSQLLPLLLASQRQAWVEQASAVLETMQDSGLHERVGGGFHRYSVDRQWRVPHFEKMLYDNAQLIGAYAQAAIQLERHDFLQTARNAGDYLLRDLRVVEDGAFMGYASAEDADDPDGEGSFYAWSPDALQSALGAAEAQRLSEQWDIRAGQRQRSAHGHDEPCSGHIPHPRGATGWSALDARQRQQQRSDWNRHLPRLRELRALRPRPGRDDKVLTDQNALALEALSTLGRLGGEERFIAASRELAQILMARHGADGLIRLPHRPAYITDYGFLVAGLCAAFTLLGDATLVTSAMRIADEAVSRLRAQDGGFYTTPADRGDLVRRGREQTDNAWPAGQNALAVGFIRLWGITQDQRWRELAQGIFASCAQTINQAPSACATVLHAWLLAARHPPVVVIAGAAQDPLTLELSAHARRSAIPGLIIIPAASCAAQPWSILDGRRDLSTPQALLCLGERCLAPAGNVAELDDRLAQATRSLEHHAPRF